MDKYTGTDAAKAIYLSEGHITLARAALLCRESPACRTSVFSGEISCFTEKIFIAGRYYPAPLNYPAFVTFETSQPVLRPAGCIDFYGSQDIRSFVFVLLPML